MPHRLRYNLVDVFTDTPLTGNPLAVFTNGAGLSAETMQAIAREMNLSETVFFLRPERGGQVKVRIFTPFVELPFAGHPVLGSAWVLAGPMEMNVLELETGAGTISVELERKGDRLHVAHMTQPLPRFTTFEMEGALRDALGLSSRGDLLPAVLAENGPAHVLIEAENPSQIDALAPNHAQVARVTKAGVLVFAQRGDQCHARYFAPAAGIDEDPATGSAAGPLGAYLVLNDRHPSGQQLIVLQGSKMGRPSTLLVSAECRGQKIDRVRVGGSAVVIARGEMHLP